MRNVEELCKDLHLPVASDKDERGFYLLPLSSSLSIYVKELEPGAFLLSTISPCPKEKKEELFIYLMKANLFGQGTLGSTIALSEDGKDLTLSNTFPYEMDYRTFRESVEDFANIVDYWKEEVAKHIELARGGIFKT